MSEVPADPIVSVHEVVVQFDGPGGSVQRVLDGVTFDVQRGETLVIMGGSGSGKSTLLNCLIGELTPASGEIVYRLPELGEVDIRRADVTTLDRLRTRFGILFQSGALYSSLTVGDNIALPLREHTNLSSKVIDIVVAIKLQQVNMLPHRDKYPSQLSGGQRKRVGLARATSLDPEILYYDEPSAGLDPITTSTIDELIMDLGRKLAVTSIVVTHDMASAFRIADRMIMLEAGKVLRSGPRSEFERLRDADQEELADDERRIHFFLRGISARRRSGDAELELYEQVLEGQPTVRDRVQA